MGNEPEKRRPAVIVIRLDIDSGGEVVTLLMRQIQPLLPPGADGWIGIEDYYRQVDELLVSFGQAPRVGAVGETP